MARDRLSAKRIASVALLTTIGLIMFIIESLFPPLFIPGAKMGLSNIMTLFALAILSPVDAIFVTIARTVIGSFFVGSLSTLIYSLTAGLVSVLLSSALYKWVFPKISIVAISAVSAVVHNVVQNIIFCLVTNTPNMLIFLPHLSAIGIVSGVIVGVAVAFLIKRLPEQLIEKLRG